MTLAVSGRSKVWLCARRLRRATCPIRVDTVLSIIRISLPHNGRATSALSRFRLCAGSI
jgi:hypothetical protein